MTTDRIIIMGKVTESFDSHGCRHQYIAVDWGFYDKYMGKAVQIEILPDDRSELTLDY